MNKNTSHKLITWVSFTLGTISSLILLFILKNRPATKHEFVDKSIPKIKLPDEIEIEQFPAPIMETQPDIPKTKQNPKQTNDLKKIEGIGPKISQLLSEHNINTFTELANTDVEDLKMILIEAKISIADPSTWPEQASYIVRDDWEGLKTFQQELKGGRREG
jgi:predicted flap endonuclease-1-like 5' DNA nuclease